MQKTETFNIETGMGEYHGRALYFGLRVRV
jgi:hypothetical protein